MRRKKEKIYSPDQYEVPRGKGDTTRFVGMYE